MPRGQLSWSTLWIWFKKENSPGRGHWRPLPNHYSAGLCCDEHPTGCSEWVVTAAWSGSTCFQLCPSLGRVASCQIMPTFSAIIPERAGPMAAGWGQRKRNTSVNQGSKASSLCGLQDLDKEWPQSATAHKLVGVPCYHGARASWAEVWSLFLALTKEKIIKKQTNKRLLFYTHINSPLTRRGKKKTNTLFQMHF